MGMAKKNKRTNNDLQKTTQKTKYRATQSSLRTDDKLMCFGRVSSSCFTSCTCPVTLVGCCWCIPCTRM